MQIWMREKEVGIVNVKYDESMARTELWKSAEPAEVEQGTLGVVVVQVELYHPKRRQPHQELHKRHQDGEAR